MTGTMADDLALLLDERAVHAVLLRYCRGIDRCDPELLQSVYHPGAYDDHAVYRGDAAGFVDFVVHDWNISLPGIADMSAMLQNVVHGSQDRSDPGYRALALDDPR